MGMLFEAVVASVTATAQLRCCLLPDVDGNCACARPRFRLIHLDSTLPPPVQTKTSVFLIFTLESVWPPYLDTQVRT